LYSNGLHVRTHLLGIGQYFPLLYFYIVIGYVNQTITVEIYVAPIEEDMLLGLDFLESNGVSLHLKECPHSHD
jgi:hypothetical protein